MTASLVDSRSHRVAILAPTGKDAILASAVLAESLIESIVCHDIASVVQAIDEGVGLILIAEEAAADPGFQALAANLARQPPWSDLPVLLLTRYGADSGTVDMALSALSNITLLERPVRPATLVSTVWAAQKARDRQYQIRSYLAERERAEESLRVADRRKDEFLATLAHELRNPLAPIRNSLHILRLSAADNPAVAQICETLERQTGLLVRLVDDLLEVSRITQGKIELRVEPVELAAVIRHAVEISKPFIDSFGHNLAIAIPGEALIVDGDEVRLSQVFSNLLNNAAKYMNPGGQIWITVRQENDQAIVAVKDTGIGIAPDKLPGIFEMFTQIDRSSRQAQGGLGIGLTLVRALVEMHGGRVEARSKGLQLGSEFLVTIPLSKQSIAKRTADASRTPSVLPHRRVLVVDDNRDSANSLGRLLSLLGADVQVANDGPTALEMLESYRPAVVLLDLGMPNMDGYEVARRIRSQPEFVNLVLIALTGWGQEQDRRRTTEAGFNYHLTKPADLKALETLLALDATNQTGPW
jgi:signal transduction histidine kinase/ActR/RegA family two-component response regulator